MIPLVYREVACSAGRWGEVRWMGLKDDSSEVWASKVLRMDGGTAMDGAACPLKGWESRDQSNWARTATVEFRRLL